MTTDIVQVKRLRTIGELRDRLHVLGITEQLGVDDAVAPDGPLAEPFTYTDGFAGTRTVGNRFAVLPMEGWDGDPDGSPTDLVRRRWRRFGESGAKLVWGGEAVAVTHDGRANPRQLVIDRSTVDQLGELRAELVDAHVTAHANDDGLVVGLQLTHSGRWSRPTGAAQPRIAYHHPVLDERVGANAEALLSDDDLDALVATYVDAAALAADAGFDFVDVKHCHGYLLHELLGAVDRPGAYGGTFEHRTAFLRRVVERVRTRVPSLGIGVRLSAYDFVPYEAADDGIGTPVRDARGLARYAFGADSSGIAGDLAHAHRVLDLCRELGIGLVCITAGSPYYNPHIQRPAFFPPSDGYTPPEDPLVGSGADDRGHRGVDARPPRPRGRGFGLLVSPAVVAQRRATRGAYGRGGLGRHRSRHAELPALARRRVGWSATRGVAAVSHVQRLHHRAPQRARVRLLPARRLLQGFSRAHRARRDQEGDAEADSTMTISPGLCSITFRSRSADEVLELAVRAGVEGIEWGADGHVPPGGGSPVEALRSRCRDAGVEVVSYGSYLGFAPAEADENGAIDAVLDSAEALGVPMVRIWTELGVSPASPADDRRRVTDRTARFADAIAARGLIAALEFHPHTLTETAASANELLTTLARPNLRTHWQPDPALPKQAALAELAQVTPHLAHVHTFFWGAGGIDDRRALGRRRRPLATGVGTRRPRQCSAARPSVRALRVRARRRSRAIRCRRRRAPSVARRAPAS